MRIEITEEMKKKAEKKGSVLKQSHTRAGGAKGAVGAGITFLVFGLFSGLPFMLQGLPGGFLIFAILGIPGLIFIVIGLVLQGKKAKNYLEFYKKESGYNEDMLLQAERELLMPQTAAIGRKNEIFCYVTENFLVSVTKEACYVRRLSDMVAAFYSEEIPGNESRLKGMMFISRQDIAREPRTNPYTYRLCGGYTNALLDRESCAEAAGEIVKRNPSVITSQMISDEKKTYDLLNLDHWEEDWRAIQQAAYGMAARI